MSVVQQESGMEWLWNEPGNPSEGAEGTEAREWINGHLSTEVERIKAAGSRAIPLTLKNCGVIVEDPAASDAEITPPKQDKSKKKANGRKRKKRVTVTNRMEVQTGMDFSLIQQIMVSPGIPYPYKEGYQYIHVLAFTSNRQIALILPYLFAPFLRRNEEGEVVPCLHRQDEGESAFANDLKEWLLINQKHQRARHSIHEYHDI